MVNGAKASMVPGQRTVPAPLPGSVVRELYRLANLLGVQVTITSRDGWTDNDPELFHSQPLGSWPVVSFDWAPTTVLNRQDANNQPTSRGDVVNTASLMESEGIPGSIQVTEATYELIRDRFVCEPRGLVSVKGKAEMHTYILLSRNEDAAVTH